MAEISVHELSPKKDSRRGSQEALTKITETAFGKKMSAFFEQKPPLDASEGTPEQLDLRKQEARMACRTLIESHIGQEDRHSESRAELKGIVAIFNERYGFTDQQVEITNDLIDAYYDHRKKAIELWDRFDMDDEKDKYELNKRRLVKELTGATVSKDAKVDVQFGAWGIVIIGDNDLTNHVLYRGKTPPTDFIAGALADTTNIPPYMLGNDGYFRKEEFDHEGQHIRHALALKVFKNHNVDVSGTEPLSDISLPPSSDQVEQDFRRERRRAFEQVKDEVFAYAFNADHFPLELFNAQNGNPYDYLRTNRDWAASQSNSLYQEAAQKVFVAEYNAVISTAAASFKMLIDNAGYSKEEVIALLTDIPLEEWTKTAWRIFETRDIALAPDQQERLSLQRALSIENTLVRRPVDHTKDQQFDVVITEESKKPNWYEERLATGDIKKSGPEITHEIPDKDALSFAVVNKLLYDRTRLQVDFLNKIYGGRDLEGYFAILDEITAERTKAYIQDGKVQERDIAIAVVEVFSRLEEMYKGREK